MSPTRTASPPTLTALQLLPLLVLARAPQRCACWTTLAFRQDRLGSTATALLAKNKGFAKKKSSNDDSISKKNNKATEANQQPSSSSSSSSSSPIYSQPALYDLAFGYRDFEAEVEFLWQRHVDVTGKPPTRTLEVAAGPARHSITALALHGEDDDGLQDVYCLDNALPMQQYATETARQELAVDDQAKFHYLVSDMRAVTTTTEMLPVDTAWILLGSLQHMTTNDDVRQCLRAVAHALTDNGTLIIELPHPRETFSMVECTRNGWKVPLEDAMDGTQAGELAIVWGDDDDEFDEIRQVRQFTVRMSLQGTERDMVLEEVVPMRLFTAQEIEALATACGFRVASMHGALEEGVEVDDEDAAYRLVVVLQKVDRATSSAVQNPTATPHLSPAPGGIHIPGDVHGDLLAGDKSTKADQSTKINHCIGQNYGTLIDGSQIRQPNFVTQPPPTQPPAPVAASAEFPPEMPTVVMRVCGQGREYSPAKFWRFNVPPTKPAKSKVFIALDAFPNLVI